MNEFNILLDYFQTFSDINLKCGTFRIILIRVNISLFSATAVTTAAATTSMKMTTASTHVTTRPTARLEITTNIQTEETSMSEVPNISSGTFPTVSTTPPPVTSILNTDAIIGGVVG